MNARALKRQHRRRRAAQRHRIQRATLGWVMAGLILATGAGLLADRLMDPAAFPIQEVRFEGSFEHVAPDVLRQRVAQSIDANYFAIDLESVERAAESLDWVRRARVRRVWPDGLHVTVTEHRLVARWGSAAWLNEAGEVVELSGIEQSDALRLAGPDGSAGRVLQRARDWSAALSAVGLELKALTLNERRAWYVVVSRVGSGGIFSVALGRDGVPQRFERFVNAYRAMPGEKVSRIDHIDARYPNGVAVRLKQTVDSKESA